MPIDILTLAETTNSTLNSISIIPITLTCDSVNDLLYNSTQSASSSSISEYFSARLLATDNSLSSSESLISSSLVDKSDLSDIYVVPISIIFLSSSAIPLITSSSLEELSSSSSSSAVLTLTLKLIPV